jgi:hypothetical protein
MKSFMDQGELDRLFDFAFGPTNPGYRPQVVESPDGDGVWDAQKRFAHVAPKYGLGPMHGLYERAFALARDVCIDLGIPPQFHPGPDSTIRVLDYPPGATTAPHADWNLLTLSLYRDTLDPFRYLSGESEPTLADARKVWPGIHFGYLMADITGIEPTRHEVVATKERQRSVVFFVVPSHTAVLHCGLTVGAWLDDMKTRARKTVA